ncbi:hypothetical protein Lmor_0688 [Legionella moravica]|uniref:Predicted membrane protein n=1 Tax=Legionella moravica TaxID=39962 RepID=A0A378JX86_9GAMM|nr:DUF962 domain-containing protein [Legionella moravica]KTD35241.1 hypothetical protein Lmor_0688 [Legionella moravica]STX62637.1 Predicted membrane protein [Legionella moravica]
MTTSNKTPEHIEFKNFSEFYVFYLSQHQNPICKGLHYTGTSLFILSLILFVITLNGVWLLAGLIAGYGFAWIGHFVFEHNKPATFKHPIYSLMADFVLFKDFLTTKKK